MRYEIICVVLAFESFLILRRCGWLAAQIVFNEKLLTTYETMRVDDGRRKRKIAQISKPYFQ